MTHLENHLRQMSQDAGYTASFVEHYLLPLIYPALWFPEDFPAWGFPVIGCGVLILNVAVYTRIWRRRKLIGAFENKLTSTRHLEIKLNG